MFGFSNLTPKCLLFGAALFWLVAVTGCSSSNDGLIGLGGVYNYSPTVIESGNVTQIWWCAEARNPADESQNADTIQYESINQMTKAIQGPMTVLAETPGAWDATYTCNPRVIAGTFVNPLGDGQTYGYAMYYVGLGNAPTNNIGVAFSSDGIHWKKYPSPIISADGTSGYGVGQPVVLNTDHKSNIRMFYEDDYPAERHVAATSSDGVHFTVEGEITTVGLDPAFLSPTWGDMAYDPTTDDWYAAFNEGLRDSNTTGGVLERGQLGVELFEISNADLLTGNTPWRQLHSFDTNATGFEANFLAGIVHDPYGNVNVGGYPTISLYTSVSHPRPSWSASPLEAAKSAIPPNWALSLQKWTPGNSLLPFYSYVHGKVYETTTGYVSPSAGFSQKQLLGHLYEAPQQGTSVGLYSCKRGTSDYFVSLDSACEGALFLGTDGFAFPQPIAGQALTAVYRCSINGTSHFVSSDPKCAGHATDELLAYIPQ